MPALQSGEGTGQQQAPRAKCRGQSGERPGVAKRFPFQRGVFSSFWLQKPSTGHAQLKRTAKNELGLIPQKGNTASSLQGAERFLEEAQGTGGGKTHHERQQKELISRFNREHETLYGKTAECRIFDFFPNVHQSFGKAAQWECFATRPTCSQPATPPLLLSHRAH